MHIHCSIGPFEDCVDYIKPWDHYYSCLYDACVLGPDDDAICAAYEQYAQICRRKERIVGAWRFEFDGLCRECIIFVFFFFN